MYALYSVVLGILALGWLPAFLIGKVWRGGYPAALPQRLGWVPLRPGPRARLWVHAVSVGEVAAAVPLVRALAERWPGIDVVLSTVTGTGAEVARKRLPGTTVFTCPLDLPGAVRRALARIEPRALVVLETELWPNLFRRLARMGRPVVVVNGRISDRSHRRYRRVRRLFGRVLGDVRLFLMQSAEDARRVIDLGAPPARVTVTGNLKMDTPAGGASAEWRRRLGLGDALVWIAGSTHRGEEESVLSAFRRLRAGRPDLVLVLAPRHPERSDEVAAVATAGGWRVARRSGLDRQGLATPPDVLLVDTIGELGSLYEAGDVVFVGGSLVPVGGHNLMEPAAQGRAVLFGPHVSNFREAAALLLGAGAAVQVPDGTALGSEVGRLLEDGAARRRMGDRARAVVAAHQGALERTLEALAPVLDPALGP